MSGPVYDHVSSFPELEPPSLRLCDVLQKLGMMRSLGFCSQPGDAENSKPRTLASSVKAVADKIRDITIERDSLIRSVGRLQNEIDYLVGEYARQRALLQGMPE